MSDSSGDKNDLQKVIAYLAGCAEHNEEVAGDTHDKPEASDLMDGARMFRAAVAALSTGNAPVPCDSGRFECSICNQPADAHRDIVAQRSARKHNGDLEAMADQLDELNKLYSNGLHTVARIAHHLREIARSL
jgi:hypothetical protein